MKKIIITGVSSFIGFHLAKTLSKYYEIIATTTAAHDSYAGIQLTRLKLLQNQNIKFEILDVTNHERLVDVIQTHRPDYWINHAGYTKNYAAMDFNIELADSIHVTPLETLFSELAKVDCQGVIGTGTCMEYSDLANPHSEDEECNPSTPYGKSKLKQTLRSIELGAHYNIPTSIIRVFIPFGDYDDPRKLFPVLVEKLWKKEEMPLSTGTQERNFVPIDELIHLYFLLLRNNKSYEIYNGASNMNISVKTFIQKTIQGQRLDENLLKFGVFPLRAGEALFCTASTQKIAGLYCDLLENNFYFIETKEEMSALTEKPGFVLCSSPLLTNELQRRGYYVFKTLPFFQAEDHFLLAKKVNKEIQSTRAKLVEKFEPDLVFDIIFYLQFAIGKKEFKKHLIQKLCSHWGISSARNNVNAEEKPAIESLSFPGLNSFILSLLPGLKDTIFMTAHHRLMIDHLKTSNPDQSIGLLICSDRRKSFLKKTVLNLINLFPAFIKRKIFQETFKYPYDFIIDSSLLFERKKWSELTNKIEVDLAMNIKERISAQYLASLELEKLFTKNKPNSFYHIYNTDLARFITASAKKLGIPSTLISHGSHAINSCPDIEEDVIRHAEGLILSDYSQMVAQSPLASDFLAKYSNKNVIKSAPILWGKKLPKLISIREKYSIPANKRIILHASTPKSINSRRFVLYETPEEYLNNIVKLAESTATMNDVCLFIKFRNDIDVDENVLQSVLRPFTHVIIDQSVPFLQCLQEANVFVSYSSTTMEEALQYKVPVVQFSHINGFSFLPVVANSPLLLANQYNLKETLEQALSRTDNDFSAFGY